ncbi:LOW QUALITY PROTEIN: uncharacterized protein [Euwallacea fornicatus]|uniref:LOW QUALITY PROTEIN: uncharacterized protein n=1 Tax=Euwallacea fornicatus TaxID=995702 RepID=UPI00338FA891
MNLNEGVLNNPSKGGRQRHFRIGLMGPPVKPPPRARSALSSSKTSELPWGRSHDSLVLNSSSNKRSTTSKSTSIDEDRIVVAITEGRGQARCEVGIAVVNVTKPVLVLCQTSDSQNYIDTLTKLNIFNPSVIVFPATFETRNNRLLLEIKKYFNKTKLIFIPRKGFNKENALDKLTKICIPKSLCQLYVIKNRYYALAAASGLLTYLQENLFIYYATDSIYIEYEASEGYAVVDIATADRLELVTSNQPAQANKFSTLFGVMNRCLTRAGTRQLRSLVLQPLFSRKKIEDRLNCLEELIKNPEMLLLVQAVLPKLSKVDQLLSLTTLMPQDAQSCNNKQLNYLLLLNSVLDTIRPLKEALRNASQDFFIEFKEVLEQEEFDLIKNMIRETIHESAYSGTGQQAEQQRIWAIKPGVNGLLDLLRKTYSERVDEMRAYVHKLGQKYDLPLALANNNKKGFHIVMHLKRGKKRMKRSDLPQEFIQVFSLSTGFTMKTVEIVNLSIRIEDMLTDLLYLSNLTIHNITLNLKQYFPLFFRLIGHISYLDVLQSLAEASASNRWVRPKFDEYTEIIGSRHPILDFLCKKPPIANPVSACSHYNLHIITGPNGAGKSIFIRQVMMLQIMAQAGCFVPAESATFRLADKMFARVSNEDDMESNASTFILEMTEINYILATMTSNSLVIIDELCRATATEEGTAIAMSVCDTLARTKTFCFITTHYVLLTRIADLFFNIKVWQLQTIPSGDPKNPKSMKLDFRFSLMPGATTLRGYGIYMVRNIWPQEVMEIVDELQMKFKKHLLDPTLPRISRKVQLRYDLDCKIDKLKRQNKLTISNLNAYLRNYNNELQTLGEDYTQCSQNMLQGWTQVNGATLESLDHSIFFNASPALNTPGEDTSHVYLEDIQFNPQDNTDPIFIIPTSNQHSQSSSYLKSFDTLFVPSPKQVSINSSGVPEKMSKPDILPHQENLYQPDVNEYSVEAHMLQGEADLSYNPSKCSFNFTEEALDLTPNARLSGFFNMEGGIKEENLSQLSFGAFSQRVENYSAFSNQFQTIESSFTKGFAPPLQSEHRKTSTPVTFAPSNQDKSQFSFTIDQKDLQNLDVASVVEDLTFLAEEIEEDGKSGNSVKLLLSVCYFSLEFMNEEDKCSSKNDFVLSVGNTEIHKNDRRIMFPTVVVKEGASWSSSEEDVRRSLNVEDKAAATIEECDVGCNERVTDPQNPVPNEDKETDDLCQNEKFILSLDDEELGHEQEIDLSVNKKEINASSNSNNVYETATSSTNELSYSSLVSESIGPKGERAKFFTQPTSTVKTQTPNFDETTEKILDRNIHELSGTETEEIQKHSLRDKSIEVITKQSGDESKDETTGNPNIVIISDVVVRDRKGAENSAENAEIYGLNSIKADKIRISSLTQPVINKERNKYSVEEYKSALEEIWDKERSGKIAKAEGVKFQPVLVEEQHANVIIEPTVGLTSHIRQKNETEVVMICPWEIVSTNKIQDTIVPVEFNTMISVDQNGHKSVADDGTITITSNEPQSKINETLGISDVSKMRNLEGDMRSTSSSGNKSQNKASTEITISVSEASKQRDLDNDKSSSITEKENDGESKSLSSKESSGSVMKGCKRKLTKKFKAPLKKSKKSFLIGTRENVVKEQSVRKSSHEFSPRNVSSDGSTSLVASAIQQSGSIYPFKNLTQKAIRQKFFEQNKKLFNFDKNQSANFAKIWEDRLSRHGRPTPRQIQQTKCLATIRKNIDGVEVIHTDDNESKESPETQSKVFSSSNTGMNMNIFSDKNADVFEQFIRSGNKDYRSFNFDFGGGQKQNDSGNLFNFKQVQTAASEYTHNSHSWTFVRKRSEEFNLPSQYNIFSSPPMNIPVISDFSLSPEEFYKRNKGDTANLSKRYL